MTRTYEVRKYTSESKNLTRVTCCRCEAICPHPDEYVGHNWETEYCHFNRLLIKQETGVRDPDGGGSWEVRTWDLCTDCFDQLIKQSFLVNFEPHVEQVEV